MLERQDCSGAPENDYDSVHDFVCACVCERVSIHDASLWAYIQVHKGVCLIFAHMCACVPLCPVRLCTGVCVWTLPRAGPRALVDVSSLAAASIHLLYSHTLQSRTAP